MITEKMKPTAKNKTTKGSTLKPWASSVNNFNMVALDPPAPAALVESGFLLESLTFLSLADFLLMAFFKPPGAAPVEDWS